MSWMPYVELARTWNCAIVFFAVILGASLSTGHIVLSVPVIFAAISASLITGGGNAINDYFDVEADEVNKPSRPIPSGRIDRRSALKFSVILLSVGVAVSPVASLWCFLIALMNAALLCAYGMYSKKLAGIANVTVAYLVSSTFIFGSLAVGRIGTLTLIITACAFLTALSLEIVKDMEDVEGDLRMNAKTLPILFGEKRSRIVAAACSSTAALLSPLPLIHGIGMSYLPPVMVADGLFIYSSITDPSVGRILISLGMGIVLIAIFLGIWI